MEADKRRRRLPHLPPPALPPRGDRGEVAGAESRPRIPGPEPPPRGNDSVGAQDMGAAGNESATQGAAADDCWEEATDENGDVYYWNSSTNETAWSLPPCMEENHPEEIAVEDEAWKPEEQWDEDVGVRASLPPGYKVDIEVEPPSEARVRAQKLWQKAARRALEAHRQQVEEPDDGSTTTESNAGWQEVVDGNGDVYYWNSLSDETTWTRPPGFAVEDSSTTTQEVGSLGAQEDSTTASDVDSFVSDSMKVDLAEVQENGDDKSPPSPRRRPLPPLRKKTRPAHKITRSNTGTLKRPTIQGRKAMSPSAPPAFAHIRVFRATALYEYSARSSDELSFPFAATLYIYHEYDDGWARARYNSKGGVIPLNHVRKTTHKPSMQPQQRPNARAPCPPAGVEAYRPPLVRQDSVFLEPPEDDLDDDDDEDEDEELSLFVAGRDGGFMVPLIDIKRKSYSVASVLGSPLPKPSKDFLMVKLGMEVIIDGLGGCTGVVRYVGPALGKDAATRTGTWLGVEMNEPVGKHNGTVQGQKYFSCPDQYGVFCRPAKVNVVNANDVMSSFEMMVIEAYSAQRDGELSVQRGETVLAREREGTGWSEVSRGGEQGFVPTAILIPTDDDWDCDDGYDASCYTDIEGEIKFDNVLRRSPEGVRYKELLAGTPEAIARRLFYIEQPTEPSIWRTYLLTYRNFTTASTTLDVISKELDADGDGASTKKKAILAFLADWVGACYFDLAEDAELLEKVEAICMLFDSLGEQAAASALLRRMAASERTYRNAMVPKSFVNSTSQLTWRRLPVDDLAKQITIKEHDLISAIQIKEFMGQAWSKSDKREKAPNVLALIDFFNQVSRWVVSEILSQKQLKARVGTVTLFIRMLECLLQLKNYNAVMEIVSGLSCTEVKRLKRTWARLPARDMDSFKSMKDLMSTEGNYKTLREKIASSASSFCVPFMGMYLTDLTFIGDGNASKTPEGLVNWKKWKMLGSVYNDVLHHQTMHPPPYSRNVLYQKYITEDMKSTLDPSVCMSISKELEPRKVKK